MKKYVKSSLQITDDIIYDIFHEYWTLDDYDLPDYEELEEEYGIDREEYGRIVSFFDELDKKFESGEIETYRESYYSEELFLQLSDRRVFLETGLESDDIMWEYVDTLIEGYIGLFERQTNVKLYLLGRNNRHACVAFTLDNIIQYDKLKDIWLECEEDFIADCADYDIEDFIVYDIEDWIQ